MSKCSVIEAVSVRMENIQICHSEADYLYRKAYIVDRRRRLVKRDLIFFKLKVLNAMIHNYFGLMIMNGSSYDAIDAAKILRDEANAALNEVRNDKDFIKDIKALIELLEDFEIIDYNQDVNNLLNNLILKYANIIDRLNQTNDELRLKLSGICCISTSELEDKRRQIENDISSMRKVLSLDLEV